MNEPSRMHVAYVHFEATDAALSVGKEPHLSYQVRLCGEKMYWSIILSTEEKFEDLNGYIRVFPETDGSNEDDRKGIGWIVYLPEAPACYEVKVSVPKVQFDELLAAARLGRVPSDISVGVEGMDYVGHGVDDLKWDNKTSPRLIVASIDFTFEVFPPTRSQLNELSEKLELVGIEIKTGFKSLLYLVIGVLALMLMQILRAVGVF